MSLGPPPLYAILDFSFPPKNLINTENWDDMFPNCAYMKNKTSATLYRYLLIGFDQSFPKILLPSIAEVRLNHTHISITLLKEGRWHISQVNAKFSFVFFDLKYRSCIKTGAGL